MFLYIEIWIFHTLSISWKTSVALCSTAAAVVLRKRRSACISCGLQRLLAPSFHPGRRKRWPRRICCVFFLSMLKPEKNPCKMHEHKTSFVKVCGFVWKCLVYPFLPNGFADHYPVFKWLAIIGNINPTFSDKKRRCHAACGFNFSADISWSRGP